MATLTFNYPKFDVVEYIKKLRSVGVNQEVAEVQAQELEHVLVDMVEQTKKVIDDKDLATKGDIENVRLELEKCKLELQKEIKTLEFNLEVKLKNLEVKLMVMFGGGFMVLFGMMAKGFHWL